MKNKIINAVIAACVAVWLLLGGCSVRGHEVVSATGNIIFGITDYRHVEWYTVGVADGVVSLGFRSGRMIGFTLNPDLAREGVLFATRDQYEQLIRYLRNNDVPFVPEPFVKKPTVREVPPGIDT